MYSKYSDILHMHKLWISGPSSEEGPGYASQFIWPKLYSEGNSLFSSFHSTCGFLSFP